ACSVERGAAGIGGALGEAGAPQRQGVAAVRAFVREMAALGVDNLKFLLSGDDVFRPGGAQELFYDDGELAAIAAEAQEAGLWLAAHAQSAEAVRRAVRHGFRIVYHCSWADEAALDALESRRDALFVAPSLGATWATLHHPERAGLTARDLEARGTRQTLERYQRVMPELLRRGIRVLPGGDYGFMQCPHGENARDLQLFVDLLGFSPAQTLRAATRWGACLMGREASLGLVREGYLADLVLVEGDPLEDIGILQDRSKLAMVMKDGAVVHSHRSRAGHARMPLTP
ncbi:MAG: amidohydrolase family protein, partial [Xenophilus sp.]